MKEPNSPSSSPDQNRLVVKALRFGDNGPYDFTVARRQCFGLSGVSGVGKSLLLRAIADLDRHSGEVLLDGRPRSDFSAPQWRRSVCLVPIESRWWHETVGDHLGSGYDKEAAISLVELCGFSADVLNWQVMRLSTGEKQRLSVVRALIREPSMLLLDETGSALDADNERLLEALIDHYKQKGGSVLWVSHSPGQLARVADTLMELKQNTLKAPEKPAAAAANPEANRV